MDIKKLISVGTVLGTGYITIGQVSADSIDNSPEALAVSSAVTLQQYYQDAFNSVSALTTSSAATVLASAQSNLKSADTALNTYSRVPLTTYTNHITVSQTWINAYNEYINATTLTDQNNAKQILMDIADNEGKNNVFDGSGLDDTTEYNPADLTSTEWNKLNLYFVSLINSLHQQLDDNKTTYANTTAMAFAQSIAQGYQKANFVALTGHDLTAINDSAEDFGLRTNANLNQYENLTQAYVTSKSSPSFTEKQLYEMVYKSALNFTIYDVYSNFGHMESLLNSTTLGAAFSEVTDSGWTYLQLHVESVATPYQMLDSTKYESTYGISAVTTQKPDASQAQAQILYDDSVTELSSAQSMFSSVSSSLSYETKQASTALSSANARLSSANAIYQSVSASQQTQQDWIASQQASSASTSMAIASSAAAVQSSIAAAQSELASYQSSVAAVQSSEAYKSSIASSLASYQSSVASSLASYQSSVASSIAAQNSLNSYQSSVAQSSFASYQSSIAASLAYQSSVASYQSSVSASIAKSEAASETASKQSTATGSSDSLAIPITAHLVIKAHLFIDNS